MKEDFLHYLWGSGKIPSRALHTADGVPVLVRHRGAYNTDAGPDFLNAVVYIGETIWSGHVEMHLSSSLWYEHRHHLDPAYRNVVLHVVWHHDREVLLPDGSALPVIVLHGEIPGSFLRNYQRLSGFSSGFLNCSGQFKGFGDKQWNRWLDTLFKGRLERRTAAMRSLDPELRNHWEELLFRAVFRYMGARVNADAFYSIAETLGVGRIRKMIAAGEDPEVVFHGLAGFFDDLRDNAVIGGKKREYQFLCKKYLLVPERVIRPVFFRLRPSGFPTIRLSQLAGIYRFEKGLFAALLQCEHPDDMRKVFEVSASAYWDTRYHYTSKEHAPKKKKLSAARIDLLLLNAVFPILFTYFKSRESDRSHDLMGWAASMTAERNRILDNFREEGVPVKHAAHAQGALELHKYYCSKNGCLQCEVGQFIIGG